MRKNTKSSVMRLNTCSLKQYVWPYILYTTLCISGCSINPFGEVGSYYGDANVLEDNLCAGMYELSYPLSNGRNSAASGLFVVEATEGIENYYAAQISADVCWSASLETVFKYSGLNFSQQQFRQALNSKCPISNSGAVTANQILFAATEAHAKGQGIWVGKYPKKGLDIDYCDIVNVIGLIPSIIGRCDIQSNYHRKAHDVFLLSLGQESPALFDSISMSATDGSGHQLYEKKIILIKSLAELIIAMDKGYPVFVALNGEYLGHTVVLKQISFYVENYKINLRGRREYDSYSNVFVTEVDYLDPMRGSGPVTEKKTDTFFKNVAFSFYIMNT